MSEQQELQHLREEVQQLRRKLDDVSRKLERIAQREPPLILPETFVPPVAPAPPKAPEIVTPEPPITAEPPLVSPPIEQMEQPPPLPVMEPPLVAEAFQEAESSPEQPPSPPPLAAPPQSIPQESFEVRLGTYWLPRIGIAVLLTGMVFFAAYITPRLSVPQKVVLSYVACAILGGLGMLLEKKTPQFARVLQAGSLALAYFVTYAAHFVSAFRVIHSPTLAMGMLSVVVLLIVIVSQAKESPTLGGMALFFGYYTSVASGVATFTLASNAVLALAALYFLARNRWVAISYSAVFATYLTYMIWVWKLNRWGELGRLVFDSGYLGAGEFHLRAGFLALYWLVFTVGGLLVNREALAVAERNGLITLNNAFFFVLFSLLMHHTYPKSQWQFQFPFAGALLVSSSIAYRRFKPDRSLLDTLFLQGLGVATLGVLSYFKGVQLVAVLALESAFLLVLARWMQSRWIAWIGRSTFTIAAVYAWNRFGVWDNAMIWGVAFAAAVGYGCARLERDSRPETSAGEVNFTALYFAVVSTLLAMAVAHERFAAPALPWVWTFGAVAVALVAGGLRVREIGWAAHIPLAWAQITFFMASADDRPWTLAPSIALVTVTFGFGLFFWNRVRAGSDEQAAERATNVLMLYALLATLALIVTTFDHSPLRWRLATLALEGAALLLVAHWLTERAFVWVSHAPLAVALVLFFLSWLGILPWEYRAGLAQLVVLIAVTFAFGFMMRSRARAQGDPALGTAWLWPYALLGVAVALVATWDHCPERWRLAAYAVEAVALLLAGDWMDESALVRVGHAPLLVALLLFLFSWLGLVSSGYRTEWVQPLILIAATLAFGLLPWRRARAEGDAVKASALLWPYAFVAVAIGLATTWDHCPERWSLAMFALETLALVAAGIVAKEPVFSWLSITPMAVGAAGYFFASGDVFHPRSAAWTNLLVGLALFALTERLLGKDASYRPLRIAIVAVVAALAIFALARLVTGALLTVSWALLGFALLTIGFAVKVRPYRMAGLVALAFSLARAVFYDMARVETVYRILSFIGLGVILLVLAFVYAKNREKLAKWL